MPRLHLRDEVPRAEGGAVCARVEELAHRHGSSARVAALAARQELRRLPAAQAPRRAGRGCSSMRARSHCSSPHLLKRSMSLIIEPNAGETMFDFVAKRPASPSLLHSNVLSFSETAKLMSEGSVGTLSSCTKKRRRCLLRHGDSSLAAS